MEGQISKTRRSYRGIILSFAFALVLAAMIIEQSTEINSIVYPSLLGETYQSIDCPQQDKERNVTKEPTRRRLEFVHIPKTGGTAIESEAARHNMTWSICHFAKHQAALSISMSETICPKGSLKYPWPSVEKYHACPWWHIPPQYFELQEANPYAGADLFCVVRNVYDRLLSEYYYMGTYLTYNTKEINDAATLNAWVEDKMKVLSRASAGDITRNRTGNAPYFLNSGHYIPQYNYVFEHRRRIITHVLRFENLEEDFRNLMELYGLPQIRLPQRQIRVSYMKKLTVYNLTKKNLQLIENLYEDDFREWGYEIMSERIPEEILRRNDPKV